MSDDHQLLEDRRHFDAIINSPGEFLASRRSGFTRRRDLENPPSRVYESLPRNAGPSTRTRLFTAGRYFPKTNWLMHGKHELSQKLLFWKKHPYPDWVAASVCRFLYDQQPPNSIILAVPDKPGKYPRMRNLLQECRDKLYGEKKFYWDFDLLRFDGDFETHSAGKYASRRKLVESHLVLGGSTLHGRRVLIVDDIFTTGATLDAIASRLHIQMNASEIDYFCLARTVSA